MKTFLRKNGLYVILLALWLMAAAWQLAEHGRLRHHAREALLNRAKDTSATLSVVIRSQGRFGFIPEERLKAALDGLAESTELESVVLLNEGGDVVASAGDVVPEDFSALLATQEHWGQDSTTFVFLLALGPGTEPGAFNSMTPVVMPGHGEHGGPGREEHRRRGGGHGPGPKPEGPWGRGLLEQSQQKLHSLMTGEDLTEAQVDEVLEALPGGLLSERSTETLRRSLVGRPFDEEAMRDVAAIVHGGRGPGLGRGLGPGRGGRFHEPGRPAPPPWLSPDAYKRLQEELGTHWFVLTLPNAEYHGEMARDAQLRIIVVLVALLACLALALAWRAVEHSSNLQLRLVRAGELSRHLRELNVAAAGLAHETKNPLNIIRGHAQMIARAKDIPEATREKAVTITEEADHVTGRLNRFLDYSRPVDPKLGPVDLKTLSHEVFGILATDAEEKEVGFAWTGEPLTIQADGGMLRQVLFNLLLNALQAAPPQTTVGVRAFQDKEGKAGFDVADEGPGVPEANRQEVFRPYFTMSENGTGLGLAVVRQIVLAHGWDVACRPADGAGAIFRVGHMEVTPERR